ncbi:hypothetical protein K402DRAFT_112966 [Aulographum hederae CBS 113979]|uniref:Uncharacterized protein n=1 Tax=Aulographum hederae CBS 113979 TaxID=1176131 RepID=A0A6G1GWP4_9PEZI|nr:hypothetical protein K402DRAFT_112966 [Aulographum hederae CBS 113979]
MPWMEDHHAKINADTRSLKFKHEDCLQHCNDHGLPIRIFSSHKEKMEHENAQKGQSKRFLQEHDVAQISTRVFQAMARGQGIQPLQMRHEDFEALEQGVEPGLAYTELAAITEENYTKFFDKLHRPSQPLPEIKAQIPPSYQEFIDVFNA